MSSLPFILETKPERTEPSFEHLRSDGATEIAFNWEYDDGSASLLELYEKGKQQQWDTSTRLDWSQELFEGYPMGMADATIPIYGSPFWDKMTEKERDWVRDRARLMRRG